MGRLNERASWDQTWVAVARAFAQRSRCVRAQVAAIVVTTDNRLASPGYNGPPRGLDARGTCDGWCPRGTDTSAGTGANYGLSCVAIHAEVNALVRADWSAIQGGTIYSTRTPCSDCAKVIANSGVSRAVFPVLDIDRGYDPDRTITFLDECGISVSVWTDKES